VEGERVESSKISTESRDLSLKSDFRSERVEVKAVTDKLMRKLVDNIKAVKEEHLQAFSDVLVDAYKNEKTIGVVGAGRRAAW
jgi:hypothetical protein